MKRKRDAYEDKCLEREMHRKEISRKRDIQEERYLSREISRKRDA
jgi:hypothetical protein